MLDMIEHIVVLILFLLVALSPVLVPLVLLAALFALFVIVRRIWRWTGSWWMAVGGPVVVLLLIFVGPFWHILLQSVIFSFKQYERTHEITTTVEYPSQMDIVDNASGKTIAWTRSYEGCISWWQKMFTDWSAPQYVAKPVKGPGHDRWEREAFRDRVLFPHAHCCLIAEKKSATV